MTNHKTSSALKGAIAKRLTKFVQKLQGRPLEQTESTEWLIKVPTEPEAEPPARKAERAPTRATS